MSSGGDAWTQRQLAKYRLLRQLGEGGMGVVWEAEDLSLGRRVAVKILPKPVADQPDILERFRLEARAAAALNHPHVVQVYEVAEYDGVHVLVMELLTGGSVGQLLRDGGPLPWFEATRLIADACRGLVAAHAAGLLHRDIKPANLLLTTGGLAKLADFGIAKFSQHSCTLTPTGSVVGTPDYMSPEQCRSEALDERSDVYSLGATYFTLLTGRPPYIADTPLQTMFAHCSSPIPDLATLSPAVPAVCVRIIARALAKQRDQRYPSAAELLVDLEAILSGAPGAACPDADSGKKDMLPSTVRLTPLLGSTRRRWLIAGGGVLAAGLAGLGWHLTNRRPPDPTPAPPRLPPPPIGVKYRRSLSGHRGEVSAMRVSPDGRTLATADATGLIRLWTLPGVEFLRDLKAHTKKVLALAFTPDGQTLASGGDDHQLRLWDLTTSESRVEFEDESKAVFDLCFSPDGTLLAGARGYSGRSVWKLLPSGRLKLLNQERSDYLTTTCAFTADGTGLVMLDFLDGVELLDVPGFRRRVRRSKLEQYHSLAQLPDGRIALASHKALVSLWTPASNELVTLSTRPEIVRCIVCTPDGGNLIFAGRSDGAIHLWHLETQEEEVVAPGPANFAITALALADHGRLLLTGHLKDGAVQLWDVVTLRQ